MRQEVIKVKKFVIFMVLMLNVLVAANVFADEKATAKEVYDMVVKAANMLEVLGEEGLAAFNNPKGEFVWKDTYVQAYNCEARQCVGHPNPKNLTFTPDEWWNFKDKKGKYFTQDLCQASKSPYGGWVEYWWPKMGETEPSRKVTFIIQVPKRPYQVSAGIYDDKITIEELNKIK
jgi:cytochrome c